MSVQRCADESNSAKLELVAVCSPILHFLFFLSTCSLCLAAISYNKAAGQPEAQTKKGEPTSKSTIPGPRRENAELNQQTQTWFPVGVIYCLNTKYVK